jgi:hypothetical protein
LLVLVVVVDGIEPVLGHCPAPHARTHLNSGFCGRPPCHWPARSARSWPGLLSE